MKVKAILAFCSLMFILGGCTGVRGNKTESPPEETGPQMTEINGEIGVDGVEKTLKMPIPAELEDYMYLESLPEGRGSILLVMYENGEGEPVCVGNFAIYSTLEYDSLKKEGLQLEDELFRNYDEGFVLAYSGVDRDIFDPESQAQDYERLKYYESQLYEMLGSVELDQRETEQTETEQT